MILKCVINNNFVKSDYTIIIILLPSLCEYILTVVTYYAYKGKEYLSENHAKQQLLISLKN